MMQESERKIPQRIALDLDVAGEPAGDQQQIVVHHVAAGKFERLDQVERRLLAEHAGQHDAAIVAHRPLLGTRRGKIIAQHDGMLLDRQHEAGAHHQIDLGGGCLPRPLRPEGVELAHQSAVLVVDRDRVPQLVVGYRLAAQLAEIVPQLGQLVDVEISADIVPIVLRNVEIMRIDVGEHHLPHAGQIADHVADRREQHAVDEIDTAGHAKFDGRARNAADIALVIGVAVDDLELIAAADDAERQHAGGVNDLARHVDRHVADHLAAGLRGFPFARGSERKILEQRAARVRRCPAVAEGFNDVAIVPTSSR